MPQAFVAHCACGRVELEAKGPPLATIVCYCDDCQAAGKQIDALPDGRSGLGRDGGTISVLFRKDLVRCVRGSELLVDHKLRPQSPATRVIASCCNSNMSTRFDNWMPFSALRTFSVNVDALKPQVCIYTKHAPSPAQIEHAAPQHPRLPLGLQMKVLGAAVTLGVLSLPLGDNRLS